MTKGNIVLSITGTRGQIGAVGEAMMKAALEEGGYRDFERTPVKRKVIA